MTINVQIGERSFAVPPFMLAELELAAPFIDRMNGLKTEFDELKKADKKPSLTQAFQMTRALVEILAIGIANVDPAVTAEAISKQVNFTFMESLNQAVEALLRSSGMDAPGEVKAPKARAAKGAKA